MFSLVFGGWPCDFAWLSINLTQGSMSVEEYAREFERLMIKCDLQEAEEQTIVRY